MKSSLRIPVRPHRAVVLLLLAPLPAQTLAFDVNKTPAGKAQPSSAPEQMQSFAGKTSAVFFTAELEGRGRELMRISLGPQPADKVEFFDFHAGQVGSDPKIIGDLPEGKVVFVRVTLSRSELQLVPPAGPPTLIRAFVTLNEFEVSCGVRMQDGLYFAIRAPGLPPDVAMVRVTATSVTKVADLPILAERIAFQRTDKELIIITEEAHGPDKVKTIVTRSDCTPQGTAPIKEFIGPPLSAADDVPPLPEDRTIAGGSRVLTVINTDQGPRYLVSDGTPQGTILLDKIETPGDAAAGGSTFIGRGTTSAQEGAELVVINGAQVSPIVVAPGSESADPRDVTAFSPNEFHFIATRGGTRGWYRLLLPSTIQPIMDPAQFEGLRVLSAESNLLFATIRQRSSGDEMICSFDGSRINCRKLPGLGTGASRGAVLGGGYYFASDINRKGNVEPGRYDIASNTTAAVEIRPETDATGASNPTGFVASGRRIGFAADDGNEVEWRLFDPSNQSLQTVQIHLNGSSAPQLQEGPDGAFYGSAVASSSSMLALVALAGSSVRHVIADVDSPMPTHRYLPSFSHFNDPTRRRGYMLPGLDANAGREPLFYDIDNLSLRLVADIRPGAVGSDPHSLAPRPAGRFVAFVANDGQSGEELWAIDTKTGAATLVKDIRPGAAGSAPSDLRFLGDTLFFFADDGVHGRELWTSDLTAQGTVRVSDLAPGAASGASGPTVLFGDHLYFRGTTPATGTELAVSDGTTSGTRIVADLNPGSASSMPDRFTVAGDRLFLTADAAGSVGRELFSWDGSSITTLELRAGQASSNPTELRAVGNRVYFAADANGTSGGNELWVSDGTVFGTERVRDLRPGPLPSDPRNLTLVSGKLVFSATDGVHGHEPWILNRPGASSEAFGAACGEHGARLDASPPLIGQTLELRGSFAPQGQLAAVFFGARADQPLGLPFPERCYLYIDLSTLLLVTAFPVITPSWVLKIPLPADVSLLGLERLAFQTLFFSVTIPTHVTSTNGVVLTPDLR